MGKVAPEPFRVAAASSGALAPPLPVVADVVPSSLLPQAVRPTTSERPAARSRADLG